MRIEEIGTEKDAVRLSKGIGALLTTIGSLRPSTPATHTHDPLSRLDIVFICCSQNKENIGIINKQFIRSAK